MKRFWPLLAAIGFSICYALFSQTQDAPPPVIQWTWHEGKIYEKYGQTRILQFGLHPDGFVVWREIVAATNSPAESLAAVHRSRMAPQAIWGEMITNRSVYDPTRSVTNRIVEMPPQIPPLPR